MSLFAASSARMASMLPPPADIRAVLPLCARKIARARRADLRLTDFTHTWDFSACKLLETEVIGEKSGPQFLDKFQLKLLREPGFLSRTENMEPDFLNFLFQKTNIFAPSEFAFTSRQIIHSLS